MPDVYFAGNSNNYETKLVKDENTNKVIRMVTVPTFYKSKSLVLVNLRNLDCFEIALENKINI